MSTEICSNILKSNECSDNIRTEQIFEAFSGTEGLHMNYEKYVAEVQKLLSLLGENDKRIAMQLYTILFKYLEKKGRI